MTHQSDPGQQAGGSSFWQRTGQADEEILNVRAEVIKQRGGLASVVERIGHALASPTFFAALAFSHVAWVVVNLPLYPWFEPWDPYPFTFLATVASVEAPFIALLVLMHQERESRIEELREETHLQVALHAEREISVALRLLREIQLHHNIETEEDLDLLDHLQENLDAQHLMQHVRRDLRDAEGTDDDEPTAP